MKALVFAYHNMGLVGLEALIRQGFDIEAVFTHKDDPGENCWFGSVQKWAYEKGISVFTTEEINSSDWIAKIVKMDPDVIFSFYYRKIIGRDILDLPRMGAFNLHGSYLPRYRGRCPVNWVIINGEKQTGVTLHYMIEKPDAGDIVGQKSISIEETDTAKTLYDKLCVAAKELLDDVLPLIKKGDIPRQKQNLEEGSYYGGRKPEDGRINWEKSSGEIYNLIRGLTKPYPGAFAYLDNGDKIMIWWAEPVAANHVTPGKVVFKKKEVLVQAAKNAIKLLNIEIQGQCLQGEQISRYFKDRKVKHLK